MKFRLFHYWRSSSSWRVRWALTLKGIECDYVPVSLLNDETEKPEHLRRNPMGYVPALEIIENEQSRFLCESVAILEFLEETHPSPPLLPSGKSIEDSYRRARVRQLVETINSGTQPLQNPNVTQLHSQDPEEQKKWSQTWIRKGMGAYETLLRDTSGLYSVGDSLTFADLVLIPQCYNAQRNEVDLSQFPKILEIQQRCLKLESCKISSPDSFKP